MKKVIVSLLVLAFVALAATGTVSAQCAAKATTSTSEATVCAQCTSCVTSTCCSCSCPAATTSCCPTVACCVVTQCCEVKTVAMMPVWKPVYKAMPAVVTPAVVTPTAAVATKGAAAASGSSQASVSKQTIVQNNVQVANLQNSTGATVTFGRLPPTDDSTSGALQTGQSNTASNTNVVIMSVNINTAVAWDNATANATS